MQMNLVISSREALARAERCSSRSILSNTALPALKTVFRNLDLFSREKSLPLFDTRILHASANSKARFNFSARDSERFYWRKIDYSEETKWHVAFILWTRAEEPLSRAEWQIGICL